MNSNIGGLMVLIYTRAVLLLPSQQEMSEAHGLKLCSPDDGYVLGDRYRWVGPRRNR